MAGIRERARAEVTSEIKRLARAQLADVGAPGLSLRAISRDLGMVSSAIYRYFPSRDDLLTALIVDAYESIGAAARQADAAVNSRDPLLRWSAVGMAAYRWAAESPSEYGLIFGTPVPGYAAPADTIGPATQFTSVLLTVLIDAQHLGRSHSIQTPISAKLAIDIADMRTRLDLDIDDDLLAAGLLSWVALLGAISLIRFGHLHNVISDKDEFFKNVLAQLATNVLGLTAAPVTGARS
jgi:AcrR family transcriptional regulator